MDISKRLKSLREKHNLTQDELATKLKVSRSTVSNYESGFRTPDINILREICNIYNITLDSIFSEEIEYKKPVKKSKSKAIIAVFTSLVLSLIAIIIISNIALYSHNYGYDTSNDELKVNNSEEIAIVKFHSSLDKHTYEVNVIESLKGDGFTFITIYNRNIDIILDNYYLVFGNKINDKIDSKNSVSIDHIEIYDNNFIYELEDYDPSQVLDENKDYNRLIDYYSYYINNEEKEDVITSCLKAPRTNEIVISSKDIYKNHYDVFDLNNDFTYPFIDSKLQGCKYMDIEIGMEVKIEGNVKPILELACIDKNEQKYELCSIKLNNINSYNSIFIFTFSNVEMTRINQFNNFKMCIQYDYNSLFNSSWSYNNLDIKIEYKH